MSADWAIWLSASLPNGWGPSSSTHKVLSWTNKQMLPSVLYPQHHPHQSPSFTLLLAPPPSALYPTLFLSPVLICLIGPLFCANTTSQQSQHETITFFNPRLFLLC
ncbi:hypothetical protein XENOCAPTIV_027858 [Xenoophorus captivus]|uniref:Uncharacterized protein n=1 Tax=Xenoophorus captivus TaxID=1517983 RepID=A0ABV0RDT9_9TELE